MNCLLLEKIKDLELGNDSDNQIAFEGAVSNNNFEKNLKFLDETSISPPMNPVAFPTPTFIKLRKEEEPSLKNKKQVEFRLIEKKVHGSKFSKLFILFKFSCPKNIQISKKSLTQGNYFKISLF